MHADDAELSSSTQQYPELRPDGAAQLPLDAHMHREALVSQLEAGNVGGHTADSAAARMHASARDMRDKRQHGAARFTPLENVPEGASEFLCPQGGGDVRSRSPPEATVPDTTAHERPQTPPSTGGSHAKPSYSASPAHKPAVHSEARTAGVHADSSRRSSLASSVGDAMGSRHISSLDITSCTHVNHTNSEGGSRSWASQRSFGDEEVGSGCGDFGIDVRTFFSLGSHCDLHTAFCELFYNRKGEIGPKRLVFCLARSV